MRIRDDGTYAENYGFLAWQTSERIVVNQITTDPLALSLLHSRSHKRALVLVFPKKNCFRNTTPFFFSIKQSLPFCIYFLHNLSDLIPVFPMDSSVVNSVTDRNIDQLLAFVDETAVEVASL